MLPTSLEADMLKIAVETPPSPDVTYREKGVKLADVMFERHAIGKECKDIRRN